MQELTRSGALYDMALECAYRREFGDCHHSFGETACSSCKYNIARCGNFADGALRLFIFKAEGAACYSKSYSRTVKRYLLIFLIIVAVCFFALRQVNIEQAKQWEASKQEVTR